MALLSKAISAQGSQAGFVAGHPAMPPACRPVIRVETPDAYCIRVAEPGKSCPPGAVRREPRRPELHSGPARV